MERRVYPSIVLWMQLCVELEEQCIQSLVVSSVKTMAVFKVAYLPDYGCILSIRVLPSHLRGGSHILSVLTRQSRSGRVKHSHEPRCYCMISSRQFAILGSPRERSRRSRSLVFVLCAKE